MIVTTTKILICDKCGGLGALSHRLSAYDSNEIVCDKCHGSGRLIEKTTIEPFIRVVPIQDR
jgi:DnaJ-class molecular chaperone